MLWKKPTQEELLLRQWNRRALKVRLEMLPVTVVLRAVCQNSEAIEAEENARTALLPAHLRLLLRTKRRMLKGSAWLEKKPLAWLNRRQHRQRFHPPLVVGNPIHHRVTPAPEFIRCHVKTGVC